MRFLAVLLLALTACEHRAPLAPEGESLSASRRVQVDRTAGFAVLANAAVTCTDGTIVGDVGTLQASPTGAITLTGCPVSGSVGVGSGAARRAFNAFLGQYQDLTRAVCDRVLTGTLAGVSLAPGVYCFDAAATLTGTLTLTGSGSWLFKIGTGGTGALTATNFTVVMASPQPCRVQWLVADAATLTDSRFIGSVLAGAAITTTRGVFNGNLRSKADVTITGAAVVGCDVGSSRDKDKCRDRKRDRDNDDDERDDDDHDDSPRGP